MPFIVLMNATFSIRLISVFEIINELESKLDTIILAKTQRKKGTKKNVFFYSKIEKKVHEIKWMLLSELSLHDLYANIILKIVKNVCFFSCIHSVLYFESLTNRIRDLRSQYFNCLINKDLTKKKGKK